MSLNKNEIEAFEQLKISENGIEKINSILSTEIIDINKIIINKYIIYLFTLVGLFVYALYFNSDKVDNLASFGTMVLPIIAWITGLYNIQEERYHNEEVILSKKNLYLVFNGILKNRIKKISTTKYNAMIHLFCYLFVIIGLVMFEHWFMLIIFVVLTIFVLIAIHHKIKLVQSDFVKEINAIRE